MNGYVRGPGDILIKIFKTVLVIIAVGIIIWWSEKAYQASPARYGTESLYTESVDEARTFSKQCYGRNSNVLSVTEHSFGAWEMTCKWREE